jgi:hypothetical protein
MTDTCRDGLQGFPVQITGWSSLADKSSLEMPNDIEIQFAPSQSPLGWLDRAAGLLQLHGQNTVYMSGTQYKVVGLQACSPKQEGLSNISAAPLLEFRFWCVPTPNNISPKSNIAVFIIPVFQKPEKTLAGQAIFDALTGNPVRLESCLPSGHGADIVKYVTCVETSDKQTKNISVAYWINGADVNPEMKRALPSTFPKGSIPNLFGYNFLTTFEQYNDEARTKGNRKYLVEGNLQDAYTTTVTLSATSTTFQTAFRIIRKFVLRTQGADRALDKYKCIAIDRERDIRNGQLIVDPKTGRRLDEEVSLAKEQEAESSYEPPTTSARNIFTTIAIILGIFLGITILAALVFYFGKIFYRNGEGLQPDGSLAGSISPGSK